MFIPSAALVAEDDVTTSTFAQLRLGEASLAPHKYRASRPIREVRAPCTLAALACFIGLILVANSQNLCLEYERRAGGRKPH